MTTILKAPALGTEQCGSNQELCATVKTVIADIRQRGDYSEVGQIALADVAAVLGEC